MIKLRLKRTAIILLSVTLLGGCSSKSAGSYYKEGIEYFNSGNYDKAETSLAKAIELNGERADYYNDYGMNLIQLGKYEEAITYFERAILDKNNKIVNKNNKMAHRGEGIAYYKSHDYTKAIEQFNKALAINELEDLNLDILYYEGISQEKAGLYEAAVKTYTTIIGSNPGDADIYYSRAGIYKNMGDYDKSLEDYNQAIKIDSNNYDYYFGKYFLMLDSKDTEGAASVLSSALSIKGSTQKDKFNIAKVEYYMEDYDTAIIDFSEAFRNGFTQAYYFLGNIYEKQEDYETAAYNYNMYIENTPDIESAAVYNQIANCDIKLEKYEEALAFIEDGLKFNDVSLSQALKRNKIVVYEYLGRFEEAYQLMQEYLQAYPKDKDAVTEDEFLKTRLPEAAVITNTEE